MLNLGCVAFRIPQRRNIAWFNNFKRMSRCRWSNFLYRVHVEKQEIRHQDECYRGRHHGIVFRIPYKLRSPVHRPLPQCRQPPRLEVDRPEHDQLGHHSRDDREQAVHRLQDQWGVAHQALIAFRIPG